MTINISIPDVGQNLHPQITVLGVGGSGGNAVNNMMNSNLEGVEFIVANTDAQALQISKCNKKIQLGLKSTQGLGAGMRPDVGKQAAEEAIDEILDKLEGSHMVFIAAGMGGGTGTGAAPVIAKLAREKGILTVGVVTKPFHFEGTQRMKLANQGIEDLQQYVDTLLIIPNQNLFRIANEKTTFADAFKMADDVLYAGVRGVTDLMVQPGLINLDFSDVKNVMSEMGKAMMGTGQHSGEGRAIAAAEAAIANPLIDDVSLKGAKGLIINITGGSDLTLYEVDEAANRIKQEVDDNANIIYGTTCDERLEDVVRVSIVATGIDSTSIPLPKVDQNSNLSIDNSVYAEKPIHQNPGVVNNFSSQTDHLENLESKETIVENNNSFENPSFQNENQNNMTDNDNYQINDNPQEEEEEESKLGDNEFKPNDENENKNEPMEEKTENHDINEASINLEESSSSETTSSVRRLSLFDTLDDSSNLRESETLKHENSKSEPVFDEQLSNNEESSVENSPEEEYLAEEVENDEFNQETQETEEELLDIPTFLRRQAN